MSQLPTLKARVEISICTSKKTHEILKHFKEPTIGIATL